MLRMLSSSSVSLKTSLNKHGSTHDPIDAIGY